MQAQRSQLGREEATGAKRGALGVFLFRTGFLGTINPGGRAFLTAYNSTSDEERLRMVEGLGKGAGLA